MSLRDKTIARLSEPGVEPFLEAMLAEYASKQPAPPVPRDARELVERFVSASPELAGSLLLWVRRAFKVRMKDAQLASSRDVMEEAIVALYCLAACRLINPNCLGKGFLKEIPTADAMICGLVATALTGLELSLVSSKDSDTPKPKNVLEVHLPAGSESDADAFEREVYSLLFANRDDATWESQGAGPLPQTLRENLAGRIETIMQVDEQTLALVVQQHYGHSGLDAFAERHQVPVLLFKAEINSALMGMDESVFRWRTHEFWIEICQLREHARQPFAPQSSSI